MPQGQEDKEMTTHVCIDVWYSCISIFLWLSNISSYNYNNNINSYLYFSKGTTKSQSYNVEQITAISTITDIAQAHSRGGLVGLKELPSEKGPLSHNERSTF